MLFFAQNRRMGPPPEFSVQPLSLSFGFSSSSQDLTVNSNYPWQYVSGETSWCTVNTKSGDGSQPVTVKVNVTENTSASQTRSTTLLFRNEKGLEARVSVSQEVHEAYTISVQPTSITLQKNSGANASVTVTANQSWTVSGVPSWVTASKQSGTGNDTVTFTANSENTSTDDRSATMTFSGSISGSVQVSIKQNATEVVWDVQPASFEIDADDTAQQILYVSSNTSWTITSYPDWISVSKTSGTGDPVEDTVLFNAKSEYTGSTSRSGDIVFKNAKGTTKTVSIIQSAATITYGTPVVSINYPSDINANGENAVNPTVTYSQTWGYNGSTTGGGTISTGGKLTFEKTSGSGTLDPVTGAVMASSKGKTLSGRTEAATVKVTVSLNGKEGSASATCYQAENKVTLVTTQRGTTVNVEADNVTIGATAPASAQVSITASRNDTIITTYSSGEEDRETQEIAVVADGEHTTFTGQAVAWFSIGFTGPTSTNCVVTAVASNTSTSSRSGTVTIVVEDEYGSNGGHQITITQEGAANYLDVSPESLSFEASGGTKNINIDTNESWTIS